MAYISTNYAKYIGTSVGNGQCVAFARAAASIEHTSTWRKGALVHGATLAVGTAIATFSADGQYENSTKGLSHAAIYLGQNVTGIRVLDQWVKTTIKDGVVERRVQNVSERVIRFRASGRVANDGRNYHVIE